MEPQATNWVELLLKYIVVPGLAILGPLMIAGLAKLVQYLNEKGKESKAARVAGIFTELARSVVAELEVTLRPQLQKALADGRLSPEEGAALKKAALDLLKTKAPASLLEAAKGIFGPILDTWLGGLVERANAENAVLTPEPIANPQPA